MQRPRPGCLISPGWAGVAAGEVEFCGERGAAACARVCTRMCICIHMLVNVRICMYFYILVNVCICVYMCVCVFMNAYAYVFVFCVFKSLATVTDKNRIGAFIVCETVISQGLPSFVETNPRLTWSPEGASLLRNARLS